MGSALVGSNPADVVVNFAFAFCPFRRPWSNANTLLPLLECVHSTRVVFIPSKDKIRVRVPMDAHGGLLYMVAYNLRKVENRDRYPDPPVNFSRYSIVAVPRLVAPVAPVRFRVAACPA